ncbi:MAG: hypothetical protein V1920_05595 [Bacillota bacterium]
MKKILAILLFFILSVSIGACQVEKTYDDLYFIEREKRIQKLIDDTLDK